MNRYLRGLTHNVARVEAGADDPKLRPWKFELAPNDVAIRIEHWIESQPTWSLGERRLGNAGVKLSLTRRTRILRFVDDIEISIEPSDDGSSVTAESRSRIGKGDLGQNRRNLLELRDALNLSC